MGRREAGTDGFEGFGYLNINPKTAALNQTLVKLHILPARM